MSPHPSPDRLSAWVLCPDDSESAELKRHIDSCTECRDQVHPITRLIAVLRDPAEKNSVMATPSGGVHLSPEQRQRFIRLSAAELSPAWREHVNECDECRGAILLLRARRAAEGETSSSEQLNSTATAPIQNVIVPIKSPSRRLRFVLPSAMAAGFLLAILLFLPLDRVRAPETLSFNITTESPILLFSSSQPSTDLGFINAQPGIPFNGLELSAEAEALVVRWGPVPDAEKYILRIFQLQDLTQVDVFRGESETNLLRLPREVLRINEAYRWELSGSTRNQLRFGVGGTLSWSNSLTQK